MADVYGRVYVHGYAYWTGGQSNYWGHNAIIRTRPFIECCGLPKLPGREPLGGEILSHDFVEAALMLRAGWEVRLAGDLGGSYEEPPTSLIDFAVRSRRWCQGDLQHLRLILLQGFHPVSRVYFGMGAMAYLSSLLWLLFVVLTLIDRVESPGRSAILLTAVTLALLFLPKLWGYIALLRDRARMRSHGGPGKTAASIFLEAAISVLTAPIFMLFNVRFVIAILSGRAVGWGSQRRDDATVTLSEAVRRYGLHTSAGAVGVIALVSVGSSGHLWLLALLAGLLLSIPLEIGLSSCRLGRWMRKLGLFLGREEVEPPKVLQRQGILRDEMQRNLHFSDPAGIFRRVVLDGGLNEVHVGILRAQETGVEPLDQVASLVRAGLHDDPSHLPPRDRLTLLSNQAAMRWLHRQAWKQWDVKPQSEAPYRW
jgi:membrane glycosyltransferase